MKAENFAKMSAPTSKDSLFSGLRWGYLGREDRRRLSTLLFHESDNLARHIYVMIKRTIPGRGQCLFKKLLDFDEVCLEGAVVQEERGVCPGGQVLELCWLPAENRCLQRGGHMWPKIRSGFRERVGYWACQNQMWHYGLMISKRAVGLVVKTHDAGSGRP